MPSDDRPNVDSFEGSPEEQRIGELINEFFDRRARGEALSEEDFLAEHAAYADELRAHLGGLQLLEGIGSSSRGSPLPGEDTQPAGGSSAAAGAGAGTIRLPEIPGYEVVKLIGRGGMGVVYKAIQISTRREVALKLLLEGPLASEQARKRFEREIALAAQLKHPNIIPIYDSGSCDGRMYYAMEYVRGAALGAYVKTHRLDVRARLALFNKICTAVRHAHQRGVVHRDLKPTNVLIDGDGAPHVLDFGLAKAAGLEDMQASVTAQIVGTPAYMSPEQAVGDPGGIDIRTDVYSLGVVLYELLTDKMPYPTDVPIGKLLDHIAHAEAEPPHRHNKKVDAELSAILLAALEKAKDARYQSLDVLMGDITRYLAGEPISVRPASGLYLLKKAIWKHRLALGAAAVLIVISAGVGVLLTRSSKQKRQLVEQVEQAEQSKREAEAEAELRRKLVLLTDPEAAAEIDRYLTLLELDPQARARFEKLTSLFAESVKPGEDRPRKLIKGIAEFVEGIKLDPSVDTEKPTDLLPQPPPEMSRRPDDLPERSVSPPADQSVDRLREIGRIIGLLPTTRPTAGDSATSQPASQPTTGPTGAEPEDEGDNDEVEDAQEAATEYE